MTYFYDILFSIKVVIDGELNTAFRIVPTLNCKRKLDDLGFVFKSIEGGAIIIVEKLGGKKASALPIRRIRDPTGFTFLLELTNDELLSKIQPFKRLGNSPLPPFLGRSRKLYFNNLASSFLIDVGNEELASGLVVSDKDFASITPNKFGYTESDLSIPLQQISLREFKPDGQVLKPYEGSSNRTVQLDLPNGAYQLKRGLLSEVLFAQTDLLSVVAPGIIQIFKDNTVDYNLDINYEISFTT